MRRRGGPQPRQDSPDIATIAIIVIAGYRSCELDQRGLARLTVLREPPTAWQTKRDILKRGREIMATLNINGKAVDLTVDGETPLLWALREHSRA